MRLAVKDTERYVGCQGCMFAWPGFRSRCRGRDGMGLKPFKEQFLALPLSDESKRMIMRENAIKVLNL